MQGHAGAAGRDADRKRLVYTAKQALFAGSFFSGGPSPSVSMTPHQLIAAVAANMALYGLR
jgi:hypothetical protein